ncbi:MAG: hypothetical protein HKN32_07785, partial [Flavobacteriales bacterium]|nr:hypothetical protein [Flavobacteriales bacterium]
MKVEQLNWTRSSGWETQKTGPTADEVNFVLVFGGIDDVNKPEHYDELKKRYPKANIVMVSTAG